jgi:serine phosphatase RsbU (regulator of sigma subunit)
MREEEVKRKLLETDNARKTQELEEARNLQLSMLPRKIPTPKNLDIAAKMITANEVGGDYYDFYLGNDGTLTVAIGDATGHGMRAGTMVASIKSLFAAFGDQPDIPAFFNRCTDIIKGMNMGNIFMGMMLVKFNCRTMSAAAAGMPPVLIHRGHNGKVEELVMKGMPLGAFSNFEYQQKDTQISPGDTILLMTDGLPELFNTGKEMLDYPRLKKKFGEVANKPANEIINELVDMGHHWRKDEPLGDDCTFVVIKVKNR